MNTQALIDGLLQWIAFVAFVVLHEFAHAWTATRCGDDTPKLQGRLTLDPMAHIDWLGTVILPLMVVAMGAATGQMMLFGWGRPVQVNLNNFHHRRRDDILVSGAGPAMNLLLAIAVLAITKVVELSGSDAFVEICLNLSRLT